MDLGPFYKNQKPANDAIITVTDLVTGNVVDLSAYTSVSLLLSSPSGQTIDTSGGTCTITNASGGIVTFNWPLETILTEVGDYRWQLKLTATGVEDYTTPQSFEVFNTVN